MSLDFQFILVSPSRGGNIGSAARALKTMGFNRLVLVNPEGHLGKEAKKLAYAAHDILENAVVFDSLTEAIADLDLTIATTARDRTVFHDYLSPADLKEVLAGKGDTIRKVGVVFGREESGLTTQELEMCDLRSTIPLASNHPSLNLGQSVMLYAYELSTVGSSSHFEDTKGGDAESEHKILRQRAENVLRNLGMDKNENLNRRILERIAQAEQTDVHLMLSFHRYLMKRIDPGNIDSS